MPGSSSPSPISYSSQQINWSSLPPLPGGTYGIITFEADVTSVGDGYNVVNVTGTYSCHTVYDNDSAHVNSTKHIIVEKKVWDPDADEWVENLTQVRKNENVKFQITITYHGDYRMPCLGVIDVIPEGCLEYLYTTYVEVAGEEITPEDDEYPYIVPDAGETINICGEEINISEIEGCIGGNVTVWDFRDSEDFDLFDGDTVVIEFEANVTYYCDCTVTNWACSLIWGCHLCDCDGNYFFDCDTANVTCLPPGIIFEKTVKEGNEWVEETNTIVGETVRFKLDLTYYGNEYLHNITIVDHLPCCLEYACNANIEASYVSEDKKTIWWNLTDEQLNDGETLTIEFDAEVVKATGGCDDCKCINNATFNVEEGTCPSVDHNGSDTANITAIYNHNCNPYINYLQGDESGDIEEELTFSAKATDQDGDDVYYWFDWGDGNNSGWSELYASGDKIDITYSWNNPGTYEVKVKAKDIHDAVSEWSEPSLSVVITEPEEPEPPEPELKICITKIFGPIAGIGKIDACIKNSAEEEFSDIEWEISVYGGLRLFGKINVSNNGTIETLGAGASECVSSGTIEDGFGIVDITVTATVDGETFINQAYGIVIGRIILII